MTTHSISYFKTLVSVGQKVKKYQLVAEGASVKNGTISLGTNMLVAYMPYMGANHDDAMILSDALKDNSLASTHIDTDIVHILPGTKILSAPGVTESGKIDMSIINKLFDIKQGIPY